jgi:hypothetical protein
VSKINVGKRVKWDIDLTLLLSTVVSAALALITVLGYLSILLVEGPVLSILSLPVVEVLTLIHL